uniref:Uncharacterized protein n=1 Tax=Catagonus wagneri TaxID=51154 RepID=A0A8C3WHK9_9CETA
VGRRRGSDSYVAQFRRYLEKLGVLDTLTKCFGFLTASLSRYPRKPRSKAASPRTGRNEREL